MKKILSLMGIIGLSTTSIIPTVAFTNTTIQNQEDKNSLESVLMDNRKELGWMQGEERGTSGVYSYNDNDPYINKNEEYISNFYGSNGKWNPKTIDSISINWRQYAISREEFVKNNKYVSVSVDFAENFWNSWYGWTNHGWKNPNFTNLFTGIELTGSGKYNLVWKNSDPNHSSNEWTHIELKEEWEGNYFRLKWQVSSMVKWASGSNVRHSALIKIRNSSYEFSKYKLWS